MAASALASQLQAIALSHAGTSTRLQPRGKPSLLFDSQEAANIDLQTIYRIGKQGRRHSLYTTATSSSSLSFKTFFVVLEHACLRRVLTSQGATLTQEKKTETFCQSPLFQDRFFLSDR